MPETPRVPSAPAEETIPRVHDVPDLLLARRTVHQFRTDPVSDESVSRWLDTAVWAPNHHLTEPWRFHVVRGVVKAHLAELAGRLAAEKHADKPHVDRIRERAQKEYEEPPVVVVVSQTDAALRDAVGRDEDYAACCLAAYHIVLAAWSDGVGSFWSTGRLSRHDETMKLLGLAPADRIVAILRLGYPARIPPMQRAPAAGHTVWLT